MFIDETYNSNPASLGAAVAAFGELECQGRKWLVLGDMLELGDSSMELHGEMGVLCGKAGVYGLLTLGADSAEISRSAAVQRKAPEQISHFKDAGKLAAYLNEMLEPGDAVLLKGSRGIAVERVLEAVEGLRGLERRRLD